LQQKRLVDLLLVRLTREEEKNKVIELLVSELGLTREEAQEKVDNSPNILSEGVEMEQGRILQDRMYPFVDLLPRHYDSSQKKPQVTESNPDDEDVQSVSDDISSAVDDIPDDEPPAEDTGSIIPQDEYLDTEPQDEDIAFEHKSFDDDDDDSLIITSASEEMINAERCHICGRIPTGDYKLVPCRTCGELTCADCFNRENHVCEKCSIEGMAVDRPLDSIPQRRKDTQAEDRTGVSKSDSLKKRSKSHSGNRTLKFSPLLLILLVVALAAAAFVILDPMNLFSSSGDSDDTIPVIVEHPDSADTVAVPDTISVTPVDTVKIPQDSLNTDTLEVNGYRSLRFITVPDSLMLSQDFILPPTLSSSPVPGIEINTDSLPFIAEIIGQIAASNSIEFEGISLIRTEDGFDILLMSILHPEPAEKRAALLGSLGTVLDSTMVDQMVLYYRENQYYDANLFTFTADSFSVLSRSSSPNFLQRKQAIIPETAELITGRIFDWMTDLN
jgi:hypothetical protein